MKKYVAIYLLIIFSSVFFACRPKQDITSIPAQDIKPFVIIVEKEIKGKILGRHLNKPFGLTEDMSGNIYLTDSENDRIIKFNKELNPEFDIGGYGKQSGLLNKPTFLSFDNGLNLMVSDEQNRRISRYNTQLNFVEETIFDNEEDPLMFGLPSGVAFTEYGEMWVSDRENNQIAIFNNIGNFDRILGKFGYTGGQLASPEKIIKDSNKNFIICDAGNSRLMVYDDYGNFLKEIANNLFEYPIAAATGNNILWVLDGAAGTLFSLDKKGTMLFKFGPVLLGNSLPMKEPSDILLLDNDRLLIADTGNNRLLVCRIIQEDRD